MKLKRLEQMYVMFLEALLLFFLIGWLLKPRTIQFAVLQDCQFAQGYESLKRSFLVLFIVLQMMLVDSYCKSLLDLMFEWHCLQNGWDGCRCLHLSHETSLIVTWLYGCGCFKGNNLALRVRTHALHFNDLTL